MSTCLLRARLSPVITSTMSNATKTVIANLTSSPRMSENLVISEGGTCLTMKLPGYDYSCLTRADLRSLPDTLVFFNNLRRKCWLSGFLDMEHGVREAGMTFITGISLKAINTDYTRQNQDGVQSKVINTDYTRQNQDADQSKVIAKQNQDVDKSKVINTDYANQKRNSDHSLIHRFKLVNLGQKSFETNASVFVGSRCLGSVTHQWVHVLRSSREVAPLPKWFHDKYGSMVQHASTDRMYIGVPDSYTTMTTSTPQPVQQSDIDKFGHTNHEAYLKLILENITNSASPKHQVLTQNWRDVGPASQTVDQQQANFDMTSNVSSPSQDMESVHESTWHRFIRGTVQQMDLVFRKESRMGEILVLQSFLDTGGASSKVVTCVNGKTEHNLASCRITMKPTSNL